MSGLFGFLLEVVHKLGEILLWLLVGRKAWMDTESARNYRLTAGGVILALIIWVGIRLFYSRVLNREIRSKRTLMIALFATLAATLVLEALRRALI